ARVPGSKVNSAWLGEKIAEADGTQTTLTFRREVAPAVAASFTVNEAEQSVWNPVYGSWVVETGNRNFDNSANVAPTGKAVEQAESVASYEVGSQSLGSKDAFTLAIAWDEKDAASTRVIVVRPGSEVTKMDLTQGKAWVMKGSDEAVYRRAKEMTEEVARENKTGVKRPINVGSTPSGAIETDGTPHYWTVK
ncbi:MAG: hypothetical protein Q7S79_02320, partial [bacterium]|nr:hypothetical protein [bacterium]